MCYLVCNPTPTHTVRKQKATAETFLLFFYLKFDELSFLLFVFNGIQMEGSISGQMHFPNLMNDDVIAYILIESKSFSKFQLIITYSSIETHASV